MQPVFLEQRPTEHRGGLSPSRNCWECRENHTIEGSAGLTAGLEDVCGCGEEGEVGCVCVYVFTSHQSSGDTGSTKNQVDFLMSV